MFKDELKVVWKKELELLDSIDPEKQPDLYKEQMQRLNAIEKQLTDLENTELQVEERVATRDSEEELRTLEREQEVVNQKKRNKIEFFKTTAPLGMAFVMGLITMVWEKTDTMTSTAGRNSWRDLIKFK